MWSFRPKNLIEVDELVQRIREVGDVEGITLLGGEPLDQWPEVARLLEACREMQLSTMLFTGYEMEEITGSEREGILSLVDILITGRYVSSLRTTNHQWIGSTNQEIHYLSSRYLDYQQQDANYVEVVIEQDGSMRLLGFPEPDWLTEWGYST
jgi:anaerobic ribonucleoside-triphosphate reductase activating protein